MAYAINPPTNLRVSTQGRTFGIAVVDAGMGTQVGLFEMAQGGWNGVWTTTPMQGADFKVEVDSMGGVSRWLAAIVVKINAELRKLFGSETSAPSNVESYASAIDAELRNRYALVLGSDGVPVLKAV